MDIRYLSRELSEEIYLIFGVLEQGKEFVWSIQIDHTGTLEQSLRDKASYLFNTKYVHEGFRADETYTEEYKMSVRKLHDSANSKGIKRLKKDLGEKYDEYR